MIRVEINNIDRSEAVNWSSLTITKNLTSLVDTGSFQILKVQDGYVPEINQEVEIWDVKGENEIKTVLATDISASSRDIDGAFSNASVLSTTWTKIGSVTPTGKIHITRLGVYVTDKGTGDWAVKILQNSTSALMAESSKSGAKGEGVNANMPASGWKYFAQNCVLEAGVLYDLYIRNSTVNGSIKSQTTNTLSTASYNLLRADRVKQFDVIANGVTTPLIASNELEGVLHGSVFNLDNATYSLPAMNYDSSSAGSALNRSNVYSSLNNGAYYNHLMLHGNGAYDIRLNGINTELIFKVDTIFPARAVRVVGPSYEVDRTYSMDYSFDGTNWVNVIRNATASGTIMNFDALGNRIFYVKIYKHTTDGTGANYLNNLFSITADLNLSGIDGKIFGGYITGIKEDLSVVDGGYYLISFQDYIYELSGILVAKSFESKTGKEIIDELFVEFAPSFNTDNVVCDTVINKIVFNNAYLSDCLTRISKIIGYEWYIDQNKNVHFFQRFSLVAPFNLTDTNGNYVYKSLRRTIDATQIANQIKVRGGLGTETSTFEDVITVSGDETRTFKLPYKFANLQVWLDTGAGYVEQNVGIDNIDDFTTDDVLYNYQSDSIRFENSLDTGTLIKFAGNKKYPVMAIVSDDISIALIGLREKYIVDNSLVDATTSRERAFLELDLAKEAITDCSFSTYQDGLETGMRITIGSDLRGVSELDFIINKIVFKTRTIEDFEYAITCSTARKMGLTEFLKELAMRGDTFEEEENAVAEVVKTDRQNIEIDETIEKIGAYEINEELEIDELVQDSEVEPIWVLAEHIPTSINDPKRMGKLSTSFKLV